MKHNLKITIITILMFLTIQLFGIFVVSNYYQKQTIIENGIEVEKIDYNLPYDTQELEKTQEYSYILVFIAILLTTILLLVFLKKLNTIFLQVWYFLSVFLSTLICLNALLIFLNISNIFTQLFLTLIAGFLAYIKSFTNKLHLKNLVEFFIYPGVVSVLIPMFNMFSITILLILISIYDIIAVRKTKHMIYFAQEQKKRKLFAGICINYNDKNEETITENKKIQKKKEINKLNKTKINSEYKSHYELKKEKNNNSNNKITKNIKNKNTTEIKLINKEKKNNSQNNTSSKSAVLGGGDIAFPLLFTAVVLINKGLLLALISSIGATIGLGYLFLKSEKGKYYPAMPYITAFLFLFYFGFSLILNFF